MRGIAALALALALVGCGSEVKLLTGGRDNACSIRTGGPTDIRGVLIADPEFGTVIQRGTDILPVQWPAGYTARRSLGGEVEVLNIDGDVVATTGAEVMLGLQYLMEPSDVFPTCGVLPGL